MAADESIRLVHMVYIVFYGHHVRCDLVACILVFKLLEYISTHFYFYFSILNSYTLPIFMKLTYFNSVIRNCKSPEEH